MADIMLLSCGHSDCGNNGGMCRLIWCKLPEDLLIEVLCRLPDKPLIRFKSVSKNWNFLIANVCVPRLAASAPFSGLVFGRRSFFTQGNRFVTSDGHYDHIKLSSYGSLVGCFNGLFLLALKGSSPTRYFVHNPATKQYVSIPVSPMHQGIAFAGMAFDPMRPYPHNNSYKIIRISPYSDKQCRDFDVFSSVTGQWVSFRVPLHHRITGSEWLYQSVYLKGNFYILSKSKHLLCFDLCATDDDNKLSASAHELPDHDSDRDPGSISLSNEFLYYYSKDDEATRFNIWLIDIGRKNKRVTFDWILKYSISIDKLRQLPHGEHLSPSFIPFVVDPVSRGVIYIANNKVVLKYGLQTNKLKLFHRFKYAKILSGKTYFHPYRRCLVKLAEFSDI